MKRDFIDFFAVPDQQLDIHERLCNWAYYVSTRRLGWPVHPMWRKGRSNGRQWHAPAPQVVVDELDGHELEKAVRALPEPHKIAIRWSYVWKTPPAHARRVLKVPNDALAKLVSDGRLMLRNRLR